MDENILQLLMGALTQSPEGPGGEMPQSTPAGAVPPAIRNGDPTAELNAMLQQILQMYVMQQSAQSSMAGAQGFQGGMFGNLGGRPPEEQALQNPDLGMMF